MNLMADASSREDIWTKTMDFLNMPDWLKLEMVQSVGVKFCMWRFGWCSAGYF